MNLMETKKNAETTVPKPQTKMGGGFSLHQAKEFVGEVKAEIRRINWTSRDELVAYTKIVVAATFLLGMGIYVVDLMIQSSLMGLSTIVHWIWG